MVIKQTRGMGNMKKRIISVFLLFVMVISIILNYRQDEGHVISKDEVIERNDYNGKKEIV